MKRHLRLIKGMSYRSMGGAISATKEKPDFYTDDEAIAKTAIASGFFAEVSGEATASEPADTDSEDEGKELSEMNKSELETFATYKDVDIKGCKSKADIIAKLKEELPAEELKGKIKYGSPTMTELQKEQ